MRRKRLDHKEQFNRTAADPIGWRYSAESLKDGATVLWDSYISWQDAMRNHRLASRTTKAPSGGQLWMPAVMLLAFATENLLKALVVASDPGVIKDSELKWGHNGHDQLKLAKAAGLISRSGWRGKKNDVDMLRLLTEFVEWAGRYPVRKSARPIPAPTWDKSKWAQASDLYDRLLRAARFCVPLQAEDH